MHRARLNLINWEYRALYKRFTVLVHRSYNYYFKWRVKKGRTSFYEHANSIVVFSTNIKLFYRDRYCSFKQSMKKSCSLAVCGSHLPPLSLSLKNITTTPLTFEDGISRRRYTRFILLYARSFQPTIFWLRKMAKCKVRRNPHTKWVTEALRSSQRQFFQFHLNDLISHRGSKRTIWILLLRR